MATVETLRRRIAAARGELGIPDEEFEGIRTMWKAGADPIELAKALKCDPLTLAWALMMTDPIVEWGTQIIPPSNH